MHALQHTVNSDTLSFVLWFNPRNRFTLGLCPQVCVLGYIGFFGVAFGYLDNNVQIIMLTNDGINKM